MRNTNKREGSGEMRALRKNKVLAKMFRESDRN
jgi:hypothetical protein